MPAVELADAAATIVAAGRRLGARGLISAGEGNLSIRLDDGHIAITPSGRRKDELVGEDVVIVALHEDAGDARSVSGLRPSSDLAIHVALHRAIRHRRGRPRAPPGGDGAHARRGDPGPIVAAGDGPVHPALAVRPVR
jgi:hypothetical protein